MAFGLTLTGFVPKTLDDIRAELEAAFKASFGESIDLTPQSNFSQIIGVMAERYADLWAQVQGVYSAFSPSDATGVSLDNVAAITGTVREPSRPSTVTIIATGTPATVLSTGRVVSVAGTGVRFVTTANGTIAAVSAWASTTAYTLGTFVRNGGTQRVYVCTTAGTSAAGGPTTTASAITDGTVVWRYVGEGTGKVEIAAESEDDGPKVGNAFTITTIETPVAGWSSVNNLLDATLGADTETDAALRLRRAEELRTAGRAAVEAIRSAILDVDSVTACTVFENVTDVTDGDGLPPHSVEALVQGGLDADIREALWTNTAAGIRTYGTTSGTHVDSQGISHTVQFSRPTNVNIYVVVNVTAEQQNWPSDGADQVKAAIVAWGDAQRTGKDVVAAAIVAQTFSVVGVLDATAYIGTAPAPGASVTVSISLRQLAVYDTSRITVNVVYATP